MPPHPMPRLPMTEAAHILVVDDDSRLRSLLHRFLSTNGFRVTGADGAARARAHLASLEFDLIVLDVMMPGESGIDLTRDLCKSGTTPILLLTAMGESDDRIAGLESGADDYLTKPFEPRELLLRIQTILRRLDALRAAEERAQAQAEMQAQAEPRLGAAKGRAVRFGAFRFDLGDDELFYGDARVRLTESEAGLLRAFAENPGIVLTRQALLDCDAVKGNARTVDVQITRLRRKLENDPKFPRYLQTVRGQGYILRAGS